MTKEEYMLEAIKEAKKAYKKDEVPVGAIIVYKDEIIARGHNLRVTSNKTHDHAEIVAITKANKEIGSWRLEECDLYVTMEPCLMCAGAIMQSRIRKVYFGAYDLKSGVLGSVCNIYEVKGFNHYPEVEGGVLKDQCSELLTSFFKKLRNKD